MKIKRPTLAGKDARRGDVPQPKLVTRDPAPVARPGLTATTALIAQGSTQIAAMPSQLKVPRLTAAQDADLTLVVDPQAYLIGRELCTVVDSAPAVGPATGVTGAKLGGLCAKFKAFGDLKDTIDEVSQEVSDSRQVLGKALMLFSDRIDALVQAKLAPGGAPPEYQDRLREDYQAVQLKKDEYKKTLLARGNQTKDATAAQKQAVQNIEAQGQMADTMVALRRGEQVAPQDQAAANATYESLNAPPSANRRGNGR